MNLHRNDNVIILHGKDRGKKGKVIRVVKAKANDFRKSERIVVEGLNMIKRHQRPRRQGQKGQIISKERAIDISNVQLVCPKCGKATRIGYRIDGPNKYRVCKKCGLDIKNA